MGLRSRVRAHVGATVGIAVVVLGGAGVATAAVVVTPAASSDEVFDAPATTEPAATTTAEAVPTTEAPTSPVVEPPTATVQGVTEPAPQAPTAAAVEPADVIDPESIGSTGTDGNYTPAPPRINPGEPPAAPGFGTSGGGDVPEVPNPIGKLN